MKKLLLILCLFTCFKAFGQTPTQPTPVNQMTWYKDLGGHMWAYRGATLGWIQMADASQLSNITFLPKANSGLHITGDSTIRWGGELLEDIDIIGNNHYIQQNNSFSSDEINSFSRTLLLNNEIGAPSIGTFISSNYNDGIGNISTTGSLNTWNFGSQLLAAYSSSTPNINSRQSVTVGKIGGEMPVLSGSKIEIFDGLNLKGAQYAADYSTVGKLDDRWIPDWGAVKSRVDSSGSNYVNLTTNQTGIGGNKTWTGDHTWHITGNNSTMQVNQDGWNITSTGSPNFYGANISDGIYAITTDKGANLFPYDLSFNRDSFTVHLTGPASISTSSKVQTLQDKAGTIALLSDVVGVDSTTIANTYATKIHVDSVSAATTQNQILLYDKSFYTSLTDFVKAGTFTPSLTTDFGILMTGGVSGTDTTNYIRLKGFTNNDDLLNLEVTFIVNDLTGFGIGVGRKHTSPSSDYSCFGSYDLVNNTVFVKSFGVSRSAPSGITVAVNDICKIIFRIRGNMLITDFYDLTQNKYATVSGVNNLLNTGNIVITEHGGSVTIKGFKAYSSSPRSPDLAILSDSKLRNPINGLAFGNWDNTFGITATFAGQGDQVTQLLQGLPYVLKYIKPKQVIVNIGRNNLQPGGVMPDSVKTQYATLVHKLDSAGINAGYFRAIPETVNPDQTGLNHLVDSLVPSRTIDVSPYWTNAIDLAGDGIHPNEAGARLLTWVSQRTGYFDTTKVYSQPQALTEQNYAKYNQNNNFNINQVVNGLVLGTANSSYTGIESSVITVPLAVGGAFPYTNSNNLVLSSSGAAGKQIVFKTNNTVRAYIDGSGNMTVGKTDGTVAVTGAKFSVSGNFGTTGANTLGGLSSTGGIVYTSSAAGLLAQVAAVATGNVLLSGGLSTAPAYGKVSSAHIDASVAPTASPTFTGTPTLPTGTIGVTQTAGNSTTAVATTAFVTTADNLKANIASPTFTGVPAAPTPASNVNTTQIPTTAWVNTYYGALAGTQNWSGTNTFGLEVTGLSGFITRSNNPVQFYGTGNTFFGNLFPNTLTGNQNWNLPNNSGTLALTSDVNSPIVGTPTISAGAGAGTSPTVSVTSNGKGLQVTVTTGTIPTGTNATVATITLPNTLPYTPYPVFSPAGANSALLNGASMIYMTSSSGTNITITSGTTALVAATTYTWNISL
jgi:hypothetical protein